MQVYCRKAPDVRYCPRTLLDQKTNGRLTMATWPRMTEKVQECLPAEIRHGPAVYDARPGSRGYWADAKRKAATGEAEPGRLKALSPGDRSWPLKLTRFNS